MVGTSRGSENDFARKWLNDVYILNDEISQIEKVLLKGIEFKGIGTGGIKELDCDLLTFLTNFEDL